MNEILRAARGAALAAGCLLALVGIVEWAVLAIACDPFAAGWGSRAISLASFTAAYGLAGLLGGGALSLALAAVARRLAGRRSLLAALSCGLLGLLYARAWVQAIGATPGWPASSGTLLYAGCPILFALGGWLLAGRAPARSRAAAPAASAAALLVIMAVLPNTRSQADQPAPAAAPAAVQIPATIETAPARNVILILADTLRADHLSAYGYARRTSPQLEAFAAQGVMFDTAIVPKTKTSPSVASLFTATWPHTHGIVNCRTKLPADSVTLAEVLRAAGFTTHSVVANANVGGAFRFDQGFDSVDEIWAAPGAGKAAMLTQHALAWLKARPGDAAAPAAQRFFLYLHYIDPHAPYAPPAPWSTMFVDDATYGKFARVQAALSDDAVHGIKQSVRLPERPADIDYYVAQYDGEIAYLDHQLGELLAGVTALGLDQDTLVVFVSDHGEALSDHDVFFSHGGFAYDDTARVPLMLRLPGRLPAGARRPGVVQTAGLAPTILEAAGLRAHPAMELRSFWRRAAGSTPDAGAGDGAFVEAGSVHDRLLTAYRTASHKLVENPGGFDQRPGYFTPSLVLSMNAKQQVLEMQINGRQFRARFELYDLAADPGETVNLAARRPDLRDEMLAALARWREAGAGRERLEADSTETMNEDVIRNLKSLGYVN